MPSPKVVKTGTVPIPLCDLFGSPKLCYTASEFKAHLEGVLQLLHTTQNYQVILSTQTPTNMMLMVKEDMRAIVSCTTPPTTVFEISEQRLTSALWEHFHRLSQTSTHKNQTVERLENYLLDLQ